MASVVPDGLPVNVVVKVHPSVVPLGQARRPDDLVIDSNKSITLTGGASTSYSLDHVYDTRATVQDVYSRTLVPALNAFLDGISCSILVFGTTASQRVETFQGDSTKIGIIPKIIDSAFVGLQRKAKALEDRGAGKLTFNMSFSFCELYDEIIQDLMDSQKRDLALKEDLVDGMVVDQLSISGPHSDAHGMIEAFQRGVGSRSTTASDFGPPSEYASGIFKLILEQEIRQPRGQSNALRASITVVDIAGADKVVSRKMAAVQASEGPRLNKSGFAFKAMCAAMRGGKHADFLPHEDSKLTLLLKESFGGNCFTNAIFTLAQADAASRGVLELAIQLREGVCYPVIMETTAQGLVRRLRLENKTVREQLAEAQTGVLSDERKVKDSDTDLMLRISELEGNSIKHNLEKLKLQEDREKLYERFREFRDKYNQLVTGKAELQSALIETEEGKLKVSKALLDLQLENNQLKEMVDQEKFDLGTKLMSAENDVVEMEMRYQTEKERADALVAQVEQLVDEKKEIAIELVSLRTNLMQRTSALKNEQAKSEDLSEHVLTLANTKRVLEQELENALKDHGEVAGRDGALQKDIEKLTHRNTVLERELKQLTDAYDESQAAKIRAELKAEQLHVEYAKKKLAVERSMQEYTSSIDTEMQREKQRGQSEMDQLKAYRTVTDAKIAQLESSVRPLQRKIAELKVQVEERERREHDQAAEIRTLEQRLVTQQEEHRQKLLQTLTAEAADAAAQGRDKMIDELVSSHRREESTALTKMQELREANHSLIQQNRQLGAAVRELEQHIEDLAPDDGAKAEISAEVREAMQDAHQSSLETKLQGELDQLRRKHQEVSQELASEKERHVTNAEGFRKSTLDLQQENEDLKAQLERSERDVERLREIANAQRDPEAEAETASAVKAMKEQFDRTLQEMKVAQEEKAVAKPAGLSEADEAEMRTLREENRAANTKIAKLQEKVEELQSQVRQLEDELRESQEALSEAKSNNAPRVRRASIVVQPQAPQGPVDDSTILHQLQETEKRAVALLSRNTVLEEELLNYKKYLKTQVKKYQSQISKLKKEVAKLKKGK